MVIKQGKYMLGTIKDINEALLESVVEITWMFDCLMESGDIQKWDDIIDTFGSSGIKNEIIHIAKDFEEQYKNVDWNNTELDYIVEIEKFAEEKLIEVFGKEN